MILTTSNLKSAIDVAFVDRADLQVYVGPPSWRAIYEIFVSCLEELIRVSIENSRRIRFFSFLDYYKTLSVIRFSYSDLSVIRFSYSDVKFVFSSTHEVQLDH